MKKIILWVIIIAIAQTLLTYQMRNADSVSANQMYELTLQRNGVTE